MPKPSPKTTTSLFKGWRKCRNANVEISRLRELESRLERPLIGQSRSGAGLFYYFWVPFSSTSILCPSSSMVLKSAISWP